jgi:hypothetical protein
MTSRGARKNPYSACTGLSMKMLLVNLSIKNLTGLKAALGIEMEIPALWVYESMYPTERLVPAMTDCNEKPARFFCGNAQNIF